MTLPPLLDRDEIRHRLLMIFPEGAPQRSYCTRNMAADTVFTMLYIGAIEGTSRYTAPKHVTKMNTAQSSRASEPERLAYYLDAQKGGYVPLEQTWYADNTREPIRDETLRNGLITVGAVLERKDLPPTSPKPRYALASDFAALFNPSLSDDALDAAIANWRNNHLTAGALATIELHRAGAVADRTGVTIHFPSGETRRMSAGPSSIITKQVIEAFAPRFLTKPAVLWVSESGNKVVARDDMLAKRLRLQIDPSRNLPDIILVDAGPNFLLVFVEVVATDGPITSSRRNEFLKIASEGGYGSDRVAFVTAYIDRDSPAFKRSFKDLAWNSFAWLASAPDHIIALLDLSDRSAANLHDLLAQQMPTTPR